MMATGSLSMIGLLPGFKGFHCCLFGLLFLAFFLPATARTERDRRALWKPFVLLILPTVLLVVPHLVMFGPVPLFPRVEYTSFSPNGRWRVEVTRRVAFPPNEGFDPSIHVVARLEDAYTRKTVNLVRLNLLEDSDFNEQPQVMWSEPTPRVVLTGLDERNPGSVTLSAPR